MTPKEKGTGMTKLTTLVGLDSAAKSLNAAARMGMPSLLIGETGTGKTCLAKEIAEGLGKKLTRINLDGGCTPDELVGRYQLKDGRTEFEYGIVPRVMREGGVLLLDEINAALPDTLFVLHALLEQAPRLLVPETEEEIVPAEGFTVVATMNPSHDYAGTKALNHALYSRFGCVLRFSPLQGSQLVKALGQHVPAAKVEHVAQVAKIIEATLKLREDEEITTRVSVREGIATLKLAQDGLTFDEALYVGLISRMEDHERGILKEKKLAVTVPKEVMGLKVDEVLTKASQAEHFEKEVNRLTRMLDRYKKLQEMLKVLEEVGSEEKAGKAGSGSGEEEAGKKSPGTATASVAGAK